MTGIHGGDIYRNKTEYDFSVSLNPLGCPDSIIDAMKHAMSCVTEYPDLYQEKPRAALSKAYGVNPGNVICTNGASELFSAIVRMVSPKTALIPAPSFYGYEYALNMPGDCRIKRHYLPEENGFELKADFLDDITEDTDIVFICNPNNPTGRSIDPGLLHRILEKCMHYDSYLVIDECFLELCEGAESMTQQIFGYDRLIVAGAFTKFFAIPGVRLGFALADAATIERIKEQLPEWNISVFAEAAAVEGCSLLKTDFSQKTKEVIKEERAYLAGELEGLGLKVFSSDTCFILFKTDKEIFAPLSERGILIRDCSNFKGLKKGFYRAAVKDHGSNEVLIKNLKEILNGT